MNDSELIFGISLAEIVPLVAGLTIFSLVMLVWYGLVEKDPLAKRAKSVARHRAQLQARIGKEEADKAGRFAHLRQTGLKKLAADFRSAKSDKSDKIQSMLSKAGMRSNEAIGFYILAKFLGPFVAITAALVVYYATPQLQTLPLILQMAGLIAMVMAGLALPDTIIGRMAKKRARKIEIALPDALDLMVICTEAGLGLDSSFDRVSKELHATSRVLSDELSLTSVELNILPNRSEALNNLLKRSDAKAIEAVVSTLTQTERYGTPLAQSFRILASDFRDTRLLRAEEKAARLPATLSVPMIGFIFPCLFAVLLGPAIIQVSRTFS